VVRAKALLAAYQPHPERFVKGTPRAVAAAHGRLDQQTHDSDHDREEVRPSFRSFLKTLSEIR
jgi:hypothetical protein